MAESSSADVKPADEQITLQIQLPDGSAALKLKVKRGTKFEKIFGAFYKNKSMAPGSVKFMFNGNVVEPTETPEGLDMDENDIIDALMQQTGGGAAAGL